MCKVVPFIILFLSCQLTAEACSCLTTYFRRSLKTELNEADFVLTGTIVSSIILDKNGILSENIYVKDSTAEGGSPVNIMKYMLKLKKCYKGKIASDTIIVFTGMGSGDCGYRFETGKSYTVFGSLKEDFPFEQMKYVGGQNIVWTNDCYATHEYSESYANFIDYTQAVLDKEKGKLQR